MSYKTVLSTCAAVSFTFFSMWRLLNTRRGAHAAEQNPRPESMLFI